MATDEKHLCGEVSHAPVFIPGLILNVRLLLETRHDVTLVPPVAVQHDLHDLQAYVWVINSDHTITRRGVKTGAFENDVMEIQDGLAPGAMVVTDNFNKLLEGMTVSVSAMASP